MRVATANIVLDLAARAEQRIRAAGVTPPDQAVLVAAVACAGKRSAKANRRLEVALGRGALATRVAAEAAAEALAAADTAADEWLAAEKERAAGDAALFDAIVAAQLGDVGQAGEQQ